MEKKVLSLLLALCMLLSLLPATAFAEVDEYYHNDDIITSNFSCSSTGVRYQLTTNVGGTPAPVYKGEEIHAHTATIYRLSSGTSVEVGEETATYGSNYPTTTATLSVTRDLTPGLYLFVAAMTVDDGDDYDDQVTGCKVFEIAGAWQDNFTDLSEAYPANTYATWSDVHRIDQDTTDGVNYAPSASLTTLGGASGFNGESNSRDLTVNLKGFVLGAYKGFARTVYQDQAVYSVKCSATDCEDHDYLAYRNVYYQLASLSDIEVYMKAHTASDWVKVRSTEEGQYADASVPASFSDITWKFTNSVKETADADANVNITLTFPAGMDVGNVDVKVVPNAEVHMTPWYWSNEITDDYGYDYGYGDAVLSESGVYKNSGAEKFTQTGCKCTATYQGSSTSDTLPCKVDPAAASHTDFVTSAEYTLAVYPNRVAVSVTSYTAKYKEIPKPTNEKLDLTYTGGANPQSHFVSYAGTAHAEAKKTLSSGSMSETGENWSWYPNNNWTGSSALAGYDIPAGTKNVLMLNNFYMEHDSTSGNDTPVILPADTTIVLADGSVNKIVNTGSVVDLSKSIFCLGNLTIMGGGALTVKGNDYGIYANGDVTVKSGTVNVTAKSSAINAGNNVNISGGTVTATGKNGIYAYNDVNISGGTVTATANGANGDAIYAVSNNVIIASDSDVTASATKYGIYAKNDVILDGGTVKVESGKHAIIGMNSVKGSGTAEVDATSTKACGIVGYCNGVDLKAAGLTVNAKKDGVKAPSGDVKLDVADVTVKAQGSAVFAVKGSVTLKNLASGSDITSVDEDAVWALNKVDVIDAEFAVKAAGYGIYASNSDVTVASGSDVTVTKAGADGIYADENVTIENSKVTVTEAGDEGIEAGNDVVIKNGSTVTVGNAGDDGIYAANNVNITDGIVLASGTDCGIAAASNTNISGGTVTATGKDGIKASNNVNISGGTVKATGAGVEGGYVGFGIAAYNNVNISGGEVTANGGNVNSYGIYAYENVNLDGGRITASGTVAIFAKENVLGTGDNTVIVANGVSDGIRSEHGKVNLKAKSITATYTTEGDERPTVYQCGIHSASTTNIVADKVEATNIWSEGDITASVTDLKVLGSGTDLPGNVQSKTGNVTINVASETNVGGDIVADNKVVVDGEGDLNVTGDIKGASVELTNANVVANDVIASETDVVVDVKSFEAEDVTAAGDVLATATDFVAADVKADDDVALDVADVATVTTIEADGDVAVTGTGDLNVTGDIKGASVELTNANVEAGDVIASETDVVVDVKSFEAEDVTAAGDVLATATDFVAADVKADDDVALDVADVATVTTIEADGDVAVTGTGDLNAGDIKGDSVSLTNANVVANDVIASETDVVVDVKSFEAEDVTAAGDVLATATSFVAGDIKANGNNGNVTVEANVATVTNIEATAKATLSKNVTVTGNVNAKNVEIKAGADVKAENVTAIVGITVNNGADVKAKNVTAGVDMTVNNGAKLTVEETASATNVLVKAGSGSNTVLTADEVVAKKKLTVEGAANNYVTATIGKATVDADTVTASETSMTGNANIKAKTADLGTFTTIPASNPKGFYVQNAQGYTTNALYWREDAGMKTSNSLVLNGVNGVNGGKFVFAPAGFAYKPVVSYVGGGGAAPVVTVTSSMPMLRKGNTGDAVKTLQAKLNALGYNCGAVDGVFGNDTYNAVVKYQKAMGISVDGVVGKESWGKLGVTGTTVTVAATTSVTSTTTTSATSNMPMLRKGNTGDAVKTLQTKLNALGHNCGAVDGVFGTNTYNAVVKFQKDKGLRVDGVVGNQTWAKLG